MFPDNYTAQEAERRVELAKMKRLATSLLILATLVYILASMFVDRYTWVGFVAATAEAAMVGAIADWFAVTALFRHPLGLRIPHTAIIPSRKDAIAAQFGGFVQQNFLSEEVITSKIRAMDLSRRVAAWVAERDNARAVAEQITAGLAGVVRVMNDDDIQAMIERNVQAKIRDTSFAPIIGDILSFITSGRRQQELFDAVVAIALVFLEDSDDELRERVGRETPWWFPSSVDRAIYERIVRSVSKTLYEMQTDVLHPFRVRIMGFVNEFMNDLRHSEDIRRKEVAIKEDLLTQPAVRDFTGSLWADIKQALLNQSERPDAELTRAIEDAVVRFGNTILADDALARKIDGWAEASARYLLDRYGHEVAALIADTIESWDPVATSERIEVQIGRDLQFIRINGTVIGGLAGFCIHAATVLPTLVR